MKNNKITTRDITYIAIGLAILISGGFVILQLSMVVPLPGVKFIMMAPYFSMIIFILVKKVQAKYVVVYIGLVFAFIMALINVFMMVAISLTALLTQGTMMLFGNNKYKAEIAGVFFSTYTGLSALFISKFLIGGVFEEISILWIIITGGLCSIFGVMGVFFAHKISRVLKYI